VEVRPTVSFRVDRDRSDPAWVRFLVTASAELASWPDPAGAETDAGAEVDEQAMPAGARLVLGPTRLTTAESLPCQQLQMASESMAGRLAAGSSGRRSSIPTSTAPSEKISSGSGD
jgi:hypothetical protein